MNDKKSKLIISKEGELLFMHITAKSEVTEFFTDAEFYLQVGQLIFKNGYEVKKHRHTASVREIPITAEVLLIQSGELEYKVWDYDEPAILLEQGVGNIGDILIFGRVAHSFKSQSLSKILEIKQGPYLGEQDKEF